jgi:signal-transduction protein with cAMP-binding, CBS, and nucleotidyltransferase domain
MSTAADVIAQKGSFVHGIAPDASVYEAIEQMVANNVGALLVVENDRGCGMVTERDYMRQVTLQGRDARTTKVREIASHRLITVEPHTSIERCMGLMTHNRIRYLPVVDGGRLMGLVSIGDIIKHKLDDQAFDLQNLVEYISGEFVALYPLFGNRNEQARSS